MPRPNVPPAVANGDPGSGLQTAKGLDELARIMDVTNTIVTPTTNSQTHNTQQLAQAQVYNVRPKHENLQSLYNEWYGLGELDDCRGGITGRDQLFGREWRLHKIHYKKYSRLKHIVEAVDELALLEELLPRPPSTNYNHYLKTQRDFCHGW
jgi:hypothetical protein